MKKSTWVSACRNKTRDEQNADLGNLFREQFKLKLQKASGELKDKSPIMKTRRNIARMKTLMSEAEKRERAK